MKKFILLLIILLAIVLRFYKLGANPPSLYWDEVSLGYNAYSILKTAHDEHGVFMPLTNFGAFGDYKPPGYIYATVPSIYIFGLNEFAVRFPSALFGVFTVILTYFLAKKIFENEAVAQIASLFLAISPWHLQFSRAAFESNMAIFFSVLGIYLFIKFAKNNPNYLLLSGVSFIVAMYTFTGQRLFVPFIVIVLVINFRKQLIKNYKIALLSALVSIILFWPLFQFVTFTIEGKLRFNEVTIFKNLEPINKSIDYRQIDNFSKVANVIHNRRFFFTRDYLINYFDAFNPSFLFSKGDGNPRLSIQTVGELYYFDLILLFLGAYCLFSKKHKYTFLIIGWLLVSPLGPSTARETPHALRMAHILPVFQLIASFGFYQLFILLKSKKILIIGSVPILAISLFYYLHMYYFHFPKEFSGQWQYGYKEAIQTIKPIYNNYDKVIVTSSLGRPYIYFLFYLKYDPATYQKNSKVIRDQFFFYNVEEFDKFNFPMSESDLQTSTKTLFLLAPNNRPKQAGSIKIIKDLANSPVLEISSFLK